MRAAHSHSRHGRGAVARTPRTAHSPARVAEPAPAYGPQPAPGRGDSFAATSRRQDLPTVLLVIGWAAFAAHIPGRTGPAFLLDIIVGAVVFSCLGFAVASLISNVDAAQPVTLAIVLPLCFLSGVFIPILELPHWLINIGKIFPVHALADALLAAYNPHTTGSGLRWGDRV